MLTALNNKWEHLSPRAKVAVGVGVLVAVFIIPALMLYYHQTVYSGKITLTFAPKSSSVKIGDGGGSFGDNSVKPGTYTIEISKKGFETYTQTVTVAANKTILVEAALVSNDPSTATWYQDHQEDYSISQGIGDRRADREHAYMTQIFPIAQDLPVVGIYSTYRVDYGISPTNSSKYAVFISYDTDTDKQDAIDAIQAKGYNLSDYEVVYEQNAPIIFDSVGVSGVGSLSKRGLSAENVNSIQEALVKAFATYQGEQVTTLTISSSVSHGMSDDKLTDTYSTLFTLNGKHERRLTVTIRQDHMTVTASAPDGSGSSTIYDGISK